MTANITIGQRGINLIKQFETLSLIAYKPTPNDVWTIGYGHTGKDVYQGQRIILGKAESLFLSDISNAVKEVQYFSDLVSVITPFTQSMFDSLCSLVFNCGPDCISIGSTIRRELVSNHNYFAACQGIFLWRKQAGKDLLGLARRRVKEMELFLEDGLPKVAARKL